MISVSHEFFAHLVINALHISYLYYKDLGAVYPDKYTNIIW